MASGFSRKIGHGPMDRLDVLNSKVDDILRFAQPRTPMMRPVEISHIVGDAIASARAAAGAHCRSIDFVPQPLVVRADPEMLRAALLNLLLNACQAGSDTVEVSALAVEDACHITVADRGASVRSASSPTTSPRPSRRSTAAGGGRSRTTSNRPETTT